MLFKGGNLGSRGGNLGERVVNTRLVAQISDPAARGTRAGEEEEEQQGLQQSVQLFSPKVSSVPKFQNNRFVFGYVSALIQHRQRMQPSQAFPRFY